MVWAVVGISFGGVVGITMANLGLRIVLKVLQPSLEVPAGE